MKNIVLVIIALIGSTNAKAQTVYVATDGTGDYNCSGTNCQIAINQALDFVAASPSYSTVYLQGTDPFVIDEPVLISSNTILTGDSTAILKLKDNVGWFTKSKPMIAQTGRLGWDSWGKPGESISNVEIHGFEINGGVQAEPTGKNYVPLIHLTYPDNVSIRNMYMRNSRWDIVRLTRPDGMPIYSSVNNNIIENSGHEGIVFVGVTDIEASNNEIHRTRTNSGIRVKDTDNFTISNNIIGNSLGTPSSGNAGILVENQHLPLVGTAEIFGNTIYGKNGGIHLNVLNDSTTYPLDSRRDVRIHHNKIYKVNDFTLSEGYDLEGGIKINGYQNTLIEHNIIEGGSTDGIVYEGTLGGEAGYQTIVRNNIIIGNQGYGIANKEPGKHTFIASNNIVYNNGAGNYRNTTPTDDINSDPLYATTHSTLNEWHHIVASYDNSTETFKIYVDGKEQASQTVPGFGAIGTNTDNLILGSDRGQFHFLEGREDELAIWDRALTAGDATDLYNDGVPVDILSQGPSLTDDLQAYLKMENNWNDSSGNGYNAEIVTGAVSFTDGVISGGSAGLFEGADGGALDGVAYPETLSTTDGLTISVWTYRTSTDEEFQTILSKSHQSQNDHIWLYFDDESVMFELGNGTDRLALEANIIDPEDMDFHVMSEYGRWDGDAWVTDLLTSPAVDQGDPLSDFSNEPSPNGGRVNIGVYGNTAEASKSDGLAGDFDGDGDVDGSDFLAWQRGDVSDPTSADDLLVWQANFGAGASSFAAASTAVPEPSSIVLLLVAFVCSLRQRPKAEMRRVVT